MIPETLIPFVLATLLILVIPGPTIILVISQAIAHGRRSVMPLVAGVFCGDFTAMTLSLLGLGVILSASAVLFTLFKWVGAIYLIYLGIKLWRENPKKRSIEFGAEGSSASSLFKSAYIVTALNPKGIAFFVAFLPQFVNPLAPQFPQLAVLGGIFLFLAVINAAIYALFASQLRATMKKRETLKWFNRFGGGAMIGAGIITAGMQRST